MQSGVVIPPDSRRRRRQKKSQLPPWFMIPFGLCWGRMKSEYVVIIGGSSGIGLAAARQLLEIGAKVKIAGRGEKKLAHAEESLKGDITSAVVDATRPDN